MNKTLAITAVTFMAVVMGISAVAPAYAGLTNAAIVLKDSAAGSCNIPIDPDDLFNNTPADKIREISGKNHPVITCLAKGVPNATGDDIEFTFLCSWSTPRGGALGTCEVTISAGGADDLGNVKLHATGVYT